MEGKNRQGKKTGQNWKDKRDKKRQKKENSSKEALAGTNADQDGNEDWNAEKEKDNYQSLTFKIGSPKFDEYYKKQFPMLDEQEYDHFVKTLQEKLPVTFRINQTELYHEKLIKMFKDPKFIEQYAKQIEEEESKDNGQEKTQVSMVQVSGGNNQGMKSLNLDYSQIKLECKSYYPNDVLYELTVPRELLKKNFGLKAIHKLILHCNDAGLLTRQEIVSMLPPLLLDVQAEHSIFDMCAAPGSKTAQLLEMIKSNLLYERNGSNTEQTKGFVAANDADHKRAFMLTHQMNRLNTSNIVILNHNAQNFPGLTYKNMEGGADNRVLFDRILCDVPCSSDAAIRKIPRKWEQWSTLESMSLHPLQAKICQRGLQLLKVGGKISYSTCSLSPIEDEAVVASLLKEYKGYIQLEKVELPGFKFREGLTDWRVLVDNKNKKEDDTSFFIEYESFDKVPTEHEFKSIKETMFANYYDQDILQELKKCLRVFPHDQNTSGFFITIIRKIKEFEKSNENEVNIKPQKEENKQKDSKIVKNQQQQQLIIQSKGRNRTFQFTRCDPTDPDIEYIKAYYGLTENFPVEQLVTQSADMQKLFFISPQVSDFLYADKEHHQLCIINMGVGLFNRNKSKFGNAECIYRIDQDGVLNLIPYMTKRMVWTSDENSFKQILMNKTLDVEEIYDGQMKKDVDDLTTGCFILALKFKGGDNVEAVVMHKFYKAVNMMMSRENIFSLHIRYLTEVEREKCSSQFDLPK